MSTNGQAPYSSKKVAIVHDALCVPGGAERVALEMAGAFPEAAFFTSAYLPERTFPGFKQMNVRTLSGSRFIKTEKQFKLGYLWWLLQLRRLDFREFDIVITSSTYLAKYILPPANGQHKAYLHAPFRFIWKPESYSPESLPIPAVAAKFLMRFNRILQNWDYQNTQKINGIATNSQNMAAAIKNIYQRTAEVIHPPIEWSKYPLAASSGDHYLSVARLISHKRVDIAVEACSRLNRKLLIIGDGPERQELEKKAGPTVHFLGRVSDEELIHLYRTAKALIFPSDEDFGIVPLEAQACGIPVLAYRKGGALETVIEGETGLFFDQQSADALTTCLEKFESARFDPSTIRSSTKKFDRSIFQEKIRHFVFRQD